MLCVFFGLYLEDDVPDHSALSRFRIRLTAARAWDGLLEQINQQKVVNDRENRDGEKDAKTAMYVIEVLQPGVDAQARWVKKGGKSVFSYKQHKLVDNNSLAMAVETTAANQHDSRLLLTLLGKAIVARSTVKP